MEFHKKWYLFKSYVFLFGMMLLACECINDSCIEWRSSCGVLTTISYPFRLTTDPQSCGVKAFELTCEANNTPTLYYRGTKFYVRSISYNNSTFRLFDTSIIFQNGSFNCNATSIYDYSYVDPPFYDVVEVTTRRGLGTFTTHGKTYKDVSFINCEKKVTNLTRYPYLLYNGSFFCDVNLETEYPYWYVTTERLADWIMPDSCRWMMKIKSSAPISQNEMESLCYNDVKEYVNYGYELKWVDIGPGVYQLGIIESLDFLISDYYSFLFARFCFGLPFLLVLVVFMKRKSHLSVFDGVEDFLQKFDESMPVRYSSWEIRKMTNGFNETLGKGGFGTVYKAKLRSGQFAAVKMLHKAKLESVQNFINEVATIGRVRHVNIVRLIGYCAHGSTRALVYEYMANGSLEKHIFSQGTDSAVSVEKMHGIAISIAWGVEYLHRGCQMQILHFDLKPHNILLDHNFVPKIADFGLAKLFPFDKNSVTLTALRGTLGYMAPEFFYRSIGAVSCKVDVYSYGKMLMEMATRKKDSNTLSDDHSSQIFLPSWVYDQVANVINLKETYWDGDKSLMHKMMIIGLCCVQLNPCDRPSMRKVIEMFQMDVGLLQLPPKPTFFPEPPLEDDATSNSMESITETSGLSHNYRL